MAKTKRTKASTSDSSAADSDARTPEPEFAVTGSNIKVRREGGKVVVSVPVKFYRRNGRQMILASDYAAGASTHESPPPNTALIVNLAKAWLWQDQLESGQFGSFEELAAANNVDRTYISRLLQLTSLSPTIVDGLLSGNEPDGLSLRQLRKGIPMLWSEQSKSPS
jgi:hypothetical protein